ncbi:MAG: class II fumarate hydratase [Thaumarchaeota archaeon]|nr:class II fumarate hydratase [Candidatus Calditenuaceae archaeon]MDW8041914.1 class II fumarate hydratase [Nitrososphaerota archaeon]
MSKPKLRVERDTLGEMYVPEDAYYGAQTARAVDNFPISGLTFPRPFIRAFGLIKYAAAKANMELGLLDEKRAKAIMAAALEVADGKLDTQFVVDVYQTGSGTSMNMNVNEVIAARANEILSGERTVKGQVHPNDHVNMGQSTNDVFPTAIHVAAATTMRKDLVPSMRELMLELERKAAETTDVVKSGRTHLQDALPVTLGQELGSYASAVKRALRSVESGIEALLELPIGGTAVGTGLNRHPDFARRVCEELSRQTGLAFREAPDRFELMGSMSATVEASASLRITAHALLKIVKDLRLMGSGPNTGFNEIEIPAVQPGSSIMPGKVNPVIPEAVGLVAVKVLANDQSVLLAAQLGELELNMGMPLIAYDLLHSIHILSSACRVLARRCVAGITANVERCREYAESSPSLVTVVAPLIGYDKAAAVAKRLLSERMSIKEVLAEELGMKREEIEKLIDMKSLTKPGIPAKGD